MSDVSQPNDWLRANDEYLCAALAWLRLRLQRGAQIPGTPDGSSGDRSPSTRLFRRQPSGPPKSVTPDVARAARAMGRAAEIDPPPALLILSQRLGLSRFEQETLLLCAAMELDTRIAGLCARAQDDPNRPYPTFALAMALFDDPDWAALSPERPLRYWRLIEINQPAARPLTTSPLRADERIVNYLKGLNLLDDRLAPLLVPFDVTAANLGSLPPSQHAVAQAIAHHLTQGIGDGRAPILQLVGTDSLSKQLVALEALARFSIQLVRLPVALLPAQPAELETLACLWRRESLLLPVALYLDARDEMVSSEPVDGQATTLHRLLSRDLGLVLIDTRDVQPGLGSHSLAVEVGKPTPAEQQAAWSDALGAAGCAGAKLAAAEIAGAQLAGQFDLNLPTIRQIARSVPAGLAEGERPAHEQVWETCLLRTRPRLDKLAQRLDPQATWDDIVLPEEQMALLRQIAGQVRQRSQVYDEWGFRQKMNRGLGISVLIAGESGTGKTMAAEVMANELQLNLYRIDLSEVFNKYIGVTEKNLRRLFDAAEDGGAILFFDEADALFGKRSEVKDSHDRYANIEINYLLQRMEAYRGLAILATNMRSALDHAFVRRLRFILTLPFPGPTERKRIWQKVFPAGTPTEALDYGLLAGLSMTGGSIHNTALNAAFLAAQAGTPVTMPLILAAARSELRKLEQPISQADFRLPEPVRARRETWQRVLGEQAGQSDVSVDGVVYERLAWFDLGEEMIAAAVQRSVERAGQMDGLVTMDLILDTIGEGPRPKLSVVMEGVRCLRPPI